VKFENFLIKEFQIRKKVQLILYIWVQSWSFAKISCFKKYFSN